MDDKPPQTPMNISIYFGRFLRVRMYVYELVIES